MEANLNVVNYYIVTLALSFDGPQPSRTDLYIFCCRCLPAPGPAVGPGRPGVRPAGGINLEAESWAQECFSAQMLDHDDLSTSLANKTGLPGPLFFCEVPNVIQMRRERLDARRLKRYQSKRLNVRIYQPAARLWGAGVEWASALETAREAFELCAG